MLDCKRILDEIKQPGVYGIFGKPRSGKTTLAAGIIAENNKRKQKGKGQYFDRIYCTDDTIKGCCHITYEEFGKWYIKDNSLIILEEAGLGIDSRDWKNTSKVLKRTIALIGHHKSTILWSSQTSDIEKCLRVRSSRIYMVEKWIGNISVVKTVDYEFGVDNVTGDLKDKYHVPEGYFDIIRGIFTHDVKFVHRKKYYRLFDSYDDRYEYPLPDPYKAPPVDTPFFISINRKHMI